MALALGALNSLPGWTAADVRWGSKERGVAEAELGAAVAVVISAAAELLPAAAATAAVVAVPQVDLSAFCLAVCLPGFARRAVKRGESERIRVEIAAIACRPQS